MDNIGKALAFFFCASGMGIFLLVVIIKVDVYADKVQAELKSNTAEMEWQGFLYRQTVQNIIHQGETPSSEQ